MLGVSCLTFAAAAQNARPQPVRPRFPPTRDATVAYHIDAKGGGAPGTFTLAFSTALQKLYVEGISGGMILDVRRRSALMMMKEGRTAMRVPVGRMIDHYLAAMNASAIERGGADRVAGQACTIWRFTGKEGEGVGCITDDGAPLRGEGQSVGGRGSFEAVSVAYGPPPASLFQQPPGFTMLKLPADLRPEFRSTP